MNKLNKPCWYKIPCGNEQTKSPACSSSISVESVLKKTEEILSKPNISYCVVYANNKNIGECLKRIKRYKRKTDQVVIVNNGCNGFAEFSIYQLFDEEEFIYIYNKTNLGCVIARNQAMKAATGNTLFVLDDDQFINADSLHKLQSVESDAVGTEAWSMDNGGWAFRIEDKKGSLAYIGGGGMIVKKKVAEQIGYLDEGYAPAWFEDADFSYKLREAGFSIGYHPNPNIEHIEHQTVYNQNDFNSQEAWKKSHRYFLNKWYRNNKKKFTATKGRKPKINIAIDVEGWAWQNKAMQLKKWLSDDFDISLVFDSSSDCDLYFSFEKNIPRNPDTPYISGITAHVWNKIPGFEKIMRNAKAIHANSMLLFNEIKHMNTNCYYLPNGVDEEQFYFKKRDIKKPFTVGYVGKDHPRKGLRGIIIPACEKAGVELKLQACRYDSDNKIDHKNMADFYHSVDCVMIASDMDGTPNMLLEAASCGRTFIANNIGNVPEFYNCNFKNQLKAKIKSTPNGLLINERKIDKYVDAMNMLRGINCLKQDGRKKCQEMGIMARKEIEKNWTWKIQVENYRKMFWKTI
jgi:GT2 family glycosyltransferase